MSTRQSTVENTKKFKKMGRPISGKRYVGFSMTVEPEMLEQIDRIFDEEGISRAFWFRRAGRKELNRIR
jgi:hypothetical protein